MGPQEDALHLSNYASTSPSDHAFHQEPEQLPSLHQLDLNSLSSSHNHSHHYPSRPQTPSRAYSASTVHPDGPLSPRSPVTDGSASPLHFHSLHNHNNSGNNNEDDSYFPDQSHLLYDPYGPRNPGDFPPEIIALIIHHLFYSLLPYPSSFPSPDPYLALIPPDTRSFFPLPARLAPSLDAQAKEALSAAALADKLWNAEATRALWRRVSFGYPRAFESVLRTIEEYSGGRRVRRPLREELRSGGEGEGAGTSSLSSLSSLGLELNPAQEGGLGGLELGKKWKEKKGSYVERWRREGSEGLGLDEVMERPVEIEDAQPLFPSPLPSTPVSTLPRLNPRDSPLLFTRSISFARFRTAGMKRSIRAGNEERFVTPDRLLSLLRGTRYPRKKLELPVQAEEVEEVVGGKYGGAGFRGHGALGGGESETETETETDTESETPGGGPAFGGWGRNSRKKLVGQMCQVGFSEYMDSAITCPILEELLFRGGYLAEYEEPDEPAFFSDFPSSSHPYGHNGNASSSESDFSSTTPYLNNNTSLVLSPGEQPFHYRHLQSSHSRSPDDGRRRSSSLSTSIAEEDEPPSAQGSGSRTPVESPSLDQHGQRTPEQEHPDSFGPRDVALEDAEMSEGARTPIGRRPSYRRRRLSGLAMALAREKEQEGPGTPREQNVPRFEVQHEPNEGHGGGYYSSEDSDLGSVADDDEHERGRERFGRISRVPSGQNLEAMGRGRSRFPLHRALSNTGNAASYLQRSSSLPAPFHPQRPSTSAGPHSFAGIAASSSLNPPVSSSPFRHPPSAAASRSRARAHSVSRASERSSSVPASIDGRWRHQSFEPVPKRMVQVLDGSTGMQPVRALDLCGCVSRVFVAGLQEFVGKYRLGPKALKGDEEARQRQGEEDARMEDPEGDDDEDEYAAGRRTPSVRSLRLGMADERVLNRTFFPHLRRLGLASSLLPSQLLTAFVLSFPYLTHLDLASTLTTPLLLKGLALAGQDQHGIGGRPMRLKALSLARCRLITGPALLGLFCGDCPPMTTMAGISDDDSNEMWGSGEVVSELTDLSLFGDGTNPCPLEGPELRLVLTVSPAFRSGQLRTLDLSSAPMTDPLLLESFPPQPNLVELGLAACRAITMQGVATFLIQKAPAVEVLDLSHSCPSTVGQGISSRRRTTIGRPTVSSMELHAVLLGQCASLESSSQNPEEAQLLLALRATNLRVVELDEKSLELVQAGAGDWKPIPGKGRRGWYVDTATSSRLPPQDPDTPPYPRPRQLLHLARDNPQRLALLKLFSQPQNISTEVGWHSRKLEILRGDGFIGAAYEGLYAYYAFS